ncbi:MAG: YIP1 family protein [Trueperaceae bacterium]|nr:YIP1 family protein [Trueperaceae bacterium]
MVELNLIGQSLALKDVAFLEVVRLESLRVALLVVFLAGLSHALGQSIVLFANEVKPRRFVASLILGALIYLSGFLFFSFSIWLVEGFIFGKEESFKNMVKVVGLAYSPYLFNFFILTPYFGSFFSVALSLWSLAAILVGLRAVLALSFWQAFVCSALGWVLLQLVNRTLGRPVHSLTRAGRRLVAGTKLEQSPKNLSKHQGRS